MRRFPFLVLRAFLCLGSAATAVAQHGEGLRVVAQGGTLSVEVGSAEATVEVSVAGSGTTTSHAVAPGKDVSIPIAQVPAGSLLIVSVGKGLRRRWVLVEVLAP